MENVAKVVFFSPASWQNKKEKLAPLDLGRTHLVVTYFADLLFKTWVKVEGPMTD